jgi:6-phosphogluconolactonase
MLHLTSYPTKVELDTALAQFVAEKVTQAIAARGKAVIALSGGRTPMGMLTKLRQLPLPWEKVLVTLVDDRWVEENHPDSNARLLREALLQDHAQAATFLPLKNSAPSPHEGQMECETHLSQLPAKLDVVILGMGEDGHTASLFPEAPELETAMYGEQRCAAISPQTAPHLRMTLTAPYISQSRTVILHITGTSKKQLLQEMCAEDAPKPYAPIRRVFAFIRTEKYVFWAE